MAELHGLIDGKRNRSVVESAVRDVNELLPPDIGFRLWPDWTPKPIVQVELIPVILIDGDNGKGPCYVPTGERLVIVQDIYVPKLPVLLGDYSPPHVQLKPRWLLGICLLHEAGHINFGHAEGCFLGDKRDFNVLDTEAKRKEESADGFAASLIKSADAEVWTSRQEASRRKIIAQEMLVNLLLINFYHSAKLRLPPIREATQSYWDEVFLDEGFTHPNLRLRFMTIFNSALPARTTEESLRVFKQNRKALDEERNGKPNRD